MPSCTIVSALDCSFAYHDVRIEECFIWRWEESESASASARDRDRDRESK